MCVIAERGGGLREDRMWSQSVHGKTSSVSELFLLGTSKASEFSLLNILKDMG